MADKNWLEVSLTVDGEMAEAVAEVLARFVPDGVVIESTAISPDPEGEGHPVGPLRVCGYLPADTDLEDTRRRLEEALWYLGCIRPLPAPQFKSIEEVNWVDAWKQHYHPIPIGQKLIIVPAWLEIPPGDRIPIRIDPGMAFGTGTHPTTQLCLEIIEDVARRVGNLPDVIDIGCGSGILSIAALKLGAERALGVDIDPQALVTARENAALNGITAHLEIGAGSVAEIRAGVFGLRQAPLVLANILTAVLIRLLNAGLGDLITPGGYLVLSGILEEQAADVETVARDHGLHIVNRRQLGDWVALLINHPAEASVRGPRADGGLPGRPTEPRDFRPR